MVDHENIRAQIERLNAGLHWSKVEALLKHMGAEVYEGAGSRVVFVIDGKSLYVHRPHPRKECGIGLVKGVRAYLRELEKTKKERGGA